MLQVNDPMENANCTSPGNQPTSGFNDSKCKDQCDQSNCEHGDDLSVVNDNREEAIEEEVLGKEFMDVESAYKFYVNYGGKHGFNVKIRNSRKNSANFVKWVLYTCSKEGFKNDHDKRRTTASYSRPVTRCGCEAHMTIQLQNNGNFKVVSFQDNHNHALISTPMKHMMKVNRSLSKAQKSHADDAEYSGISIKSTVELMSREVGGPENLGFTKKDYMNYIHRKRMSKMEKGDASAILHYFQKMQSENSSYFYSIQLDEDDMITNIFWADARSVSDYKLFGDVLCFDTTYKTNEYGRPFGPIVGVNHHN